LLFIDKRFSNQVAVALRIQDLSRQSQTWGTAIPVVRESEFRTAKIALVDVPVPAGFRQMLRIYDPDGRSNAKVTVRIFGTSSPEAYPGQPDRLLGEAVITLQPPTTEHPEFSGYYETGDLSRIAPLAGYDRVLIEIEPLTSGLRFWSFVSVTDNDTQHVTTITP
jgi:hypothetical protein